ncbi:PREDICTED: protein IRX15-LIKE-like [Prunus mume]|uniref:Protein IRX15-LIKE-like n=1 Tax=Prunus mume TaxID=102107 RepID=A0ABM0PW01_PRUMU|nr:PREDICTED: protein IRX15-LIKE-like [Prunus mume]
MKNINNTKLILLHPYIQKQGTSNHLWILAFMSIFTLAFLLTIIYTSGLYAYSSTTTTTISAATITTTTTASTVVPQLPTTVPQLPTTIINTLLYYATKSNDTFKMSYADIKPISDALRKCSTPCNFLIFGLTHETLLCKALNNNGRTVFIDENRYFAAYMEEKHPEIDATDVQYTTKSKKLKETPFQIKICCCIKDQFFIILSFSYMYA